MNSEEEILIKTIQIMEKARMHVDKLFHAIYHAQEVRKATAEIARKLKKNNK